MKLASEEGISMDDKLNALFQAYREAIPDPEVGPGFMPGLWERIEARRGFSLKLRFWARLAASAAAALCLAAVLIRALPDTERPTAYTHTYVEVLNEESSADNLVLADAVYATWRGDELR